MSTEATLNFRVGPAAPDSDGADVFYPRTDRFHALRVVPCMAEYEEMCARGELFYACNQATVTLGTGLTATAVTFTLWNPQGSPVDLVLLNIGISQRTGGTAGEVVLAVNVNASAAVPATNTALTVYNAKLDGSAGYGIAYSATTLPATPVAIRTLMGSVSTAPVNAGIVNDEVKGAVILGPNTAATVQGITVVGVALISILWRERRRPAA